MSLGSPSSSMRYSHLLTATFLSLALLLSVAVRPMIPMFPALVPLLFLCAVAGAALFGNLRSLVTAMVISALGVNYFLSGPNSRFSLSGIVLVKTGLFVVVASLACALVYQLRNARSRELRAHNIFSDFIGSAPVGFALQNPDASFRNRSEEARFRLAAIVDSSDDAIISKDLHGIVTSWNAAAERLFGYKADYMIGRSILAIIPPELHNEEPLILAKLSAGEKIDHYETERLRRDGRRVEVALTISPVRDLSGNIIGASKIARDISERRRVQEALVQSEKLAATGRMAAAIAHEVNNPLEAVTNLAYLISMDPTLSEVGRSYAKIMLDEIARASEITKQTLAFYRDSGKPSEFDVRDLLDNVIKLNRPAIERRRIELIRDYRRSEPLTGYASEIRQVLANLLLNAIDAVPDGGRIVVRVDVEDPISTHARRLRVSVADTGHGVPMETRQRLFEPFVSTKGARGNGLGLWVSKGIVQKHGGKIFMRTSAEPGRSGTVFSLVLPLQTTATVPKHSVLSQ